MSSKPSGMETAQAPRETRLRVSFGPRVCINSEGLLTPISRQCVPLLDGKSHSIWDCFAVVSGMARRGIPLSPGACHCTGCKSSQEGRIRLRVLEPSSWKKRISLTSLAAHLSVPAQGYRCPCGGEGSWVKRARSAAEALGGEAALPALVPTHPGVCFQPVATTCRQGRKAAESNPF